MIEPLVYGQICPLLYMWATLAVSQLLGNVHEHTLRLLPYVAGIASLLLFWRLCALELPRRAVFLAVGFMASAYFVVRHNVELKPYSTDLLVSLGCTALAWSVWRTPTCRWCWGGLILLAVAMPWASYPSVFVGGAAGILLTGRALQALRRDRNDGVSGAPRLAPWIPAALAAYGLALAGSFIFMYVTFARPHAQYASRLLEIDMWSQAFPPLDKPWEIPIWLAAIHTGRMFAYPQGGNAPGSIATFLLFVVGAVHLWRVRRPLAILLLAPFALALAAAIAKAYPYGGTVRTMIYTAPAICLLAGLGLYIAMRAFYRDATRRLRRISPRAATPQPPGPYDRLLSAIAPAVRFRHGSLLATALLAALPISGMIGDVRKPEFSDAVRKSYEAVRTLVREARPADTWITFNATEKVDYAPWLGDARGAGAQWVFDTMRLAPVPVAWAPRTDEVQFPPDGGRVLLMAYRGFKMNFPEPQFADYLMALESRLGPAKHTRYEIKRDRKTGEIESLDVYLFERRGEERGAT